MFVVHAVKKPFIFSQARLPISFQTEAKPDIRKTFTFSIAEHINKSSARKVIYLYYYYFREKLQSAVIQISLSVICHFRTVTTINSRTASVRSIGSKKEKKATAAARFTIYKVNKASRKKREKSSAKKERKATKTLAIVLGEFPFSLGTEMFG